MSSLVFPGGSGGKEFTCNSGDCLQVHLGSIPESGRSPGEGTGNPLQCSCLGNPMHKGAWWATVHRVARVRHDLVTQPPPCFPYIIKKLTVYQIIYLSSFICTSPSNGRRQWHPTLVLSPGKSHGWRSLVGCSPWGREESDTTERLHFHFSFHSLEKEMATHSSVLAWRIPGTGEPGGLPSMGSHRVGHD